MAVGGRGYGDMGGGWQYGGGGTAMRGKGRKAVGGSLTVFI